MADQTTIDLSSSALVPVLRSVVTKLLVSLGTWLVAHGYLTQASVDGAVSPLTQEIVGALLWLAAAGYAAYKAKTKNDKAVDAAISRPGDGKTVKVDGVVVNHA